MENKMKFDAIRPIINEAFKNNETFKFKPNGVSMLPFIRGGEDMVEISEYKGGGKKYDIVFYRRADGQYVLHRIVKIYPHSFGVCGDNQWWIEEVKENQIFAIVLKVNEKAYYGSFLYLKTLFLRRFFIHVKKYIKKHFGGAKE